VPRFCIRDPCPGRHVPDERGCVDCASPCAVESGKTFGGTPLEIENNGTIKINDTNIYVQIGNENIVVSVHPDAALDILKTKNIITNALKVSIQTTSEGKVFYKIYAEKEGKFFGLIPIKIPLEIFFDPILDKTTNVNKPWWSFFIFG